MKKLYTLFSIMIAVVTFAQAPQGFNYQATVRNSAGVLIVNQNVNFKFNIMLNSQTSVPIYSETHFAPTDDLGQVNLAIGQGAATVGTFSRINWANGSYYLGIEINTGSGYVAMGTTQLLSVPYALYANSSGNSNFNFPNGTNIGDTLNWIWNGSAWVPTSSVSNAQLPVISTIVATNTLTPSPSSGGTITSDGGYSITSKGVCWSTSPNPTISNNSTNNGTGASNFTSVLSNLLPTTTYYYRAYATNSIGTSYGITYTFTTVDIPQLTTTNLSAITSSTASSGGTISSDGGSTITAKGVCWSTSPNPTVALTTKTNNGTGTTTYTSNITGLLSFTSYYVRAYATNSFGTAYGQEEVFTTLSSTPTLITTAATSITSTTASSGGVISNDGGTPVTVKGIVWSTSSNPTITTNQGLTSDGTGIGAFTSSITQLTPGTLYYVRAYATNSGGTAYGNQITFNSLPTSPNLITSSIIQLTNNSVISGGNILSNGGSNVLSRGICWSTNPNPTVALTTKTVNGSGSGIFISPIIDLTPSTTYYIKAYATNAVGTSYGEEIVFTTLSTVSSYPSGTIHCNPNNPTAIVDVVNPTTGKIWMDRNLGASQVATSYNDTNAYGDLYQWGRRSDGHQCRNSSTTSTLSSSSEPSHGNFIIPISSPYDWISPQNTNLWQGVNGINNPCPSGYRLPTTQEFTVEDISWGSGNASIAAFASPLKFTQAGSRNNYNTILTDSGHYWSSTISSTNSQTLYISSAQSITGGSSNRYLGASVRCIKD